MKIIGVVAEFNPFHNGHAHLISQARASAGADGLVICVMSGNWTQRGEPAIVSKYPRAEIAVRCGADLVIELPTYWALSSAGRFARGAVQLLADAGVDTLFFGSECGNIEALNELADCIESENCQRQIVYELEEGVSYPVARHLAVREFLGPKADLLEQPNNNLAVEYLLAIRELAKPMKAETISRFAVHHDSLTTKHGFASAQYIRSCLLDGAWEEVALFVPTAAVQVLAEEERRGRLPADFTMSEQMVLSKLRVLSVEAFAKIPDVREGLENRLYKASRQACCMEEFLDLAKSKRYTHARLRRILMHAFLGTAEFNLPEQPPYLRVLAASADGQKHLRTLAKQELGLPIVTRASQLKVLEPAAAELFAYEERCTDLYVLCYPDSAQWGGGSEYRQRPYFVE